jgi:hypothetical protein
MAWFCHWFNSAGLMDSSWHVCVIVRRSVHTDNTAVIFCCGSKRLLVRLAVFIVYILSGIVNKFFFRLAVLTVYQHPDFTLFGADHHRLPAHATDHVKRIHRTAAKRKLQRVFLNTLCKGLFQLVLDLKKPVGRAQPPDALMRTLVVVILDPEGTSLHRLLEAVELGPLQELAKDGFPEPLYFTQSHRMVRTGADVMDPILFHLSLKAGFAPPVGVLAAVVGEHLLGNPVFGNGPAVGLKHMGRGLAAMQPKPCNVARVVVDVADQVGVSATQPKGHDVALPQLVGP